MVDWAAWKERAGSSAEQLLLWGLLNQVISSIGQPVFAAIVQEANATLPNAVLSPAELAAAANRSFLTQAAAQAEAARSGIDPARFTTMTRLAGAAPGPSDLARALMLGLIPEDSGDPDKPGFTQGIKQGNLRDIWTPMFRDLARQRPSPADILRAALQGQVPAGTDPKTLYEKLGGDGTYYQLMFDAEGSAPTPVEAAQMALRGIIPWDAPTGPGAVSFAQAFLEGPWRDKWQDSYRQLASYRPTVTEAEGLYADGAITRDQALGYMAESGVTGTLAAGFIKRAEITQLSDYRGLTKTAVLDLYYSQYITKADATTILESLHVTAQAAGLLLAYVDLRRVTAAVNSAVARVQSLYTAHKITAPAARAALLALKLPGTTVHDVIANWDIEMAVNVAQLTETQIAEGYKYGIFTQAEAQAKLEALGYSAYDAWARLSIEVHQELPGRPPDTAPPPPGVITHGGTV